MGPLKIRELVRKEVRKKRMKNVKDKIKDKLKKLFDDRLKKTPSVSLSINELLRHAKVLKKNESLAENDSLLNYPDFFNALRSVIDEYEENDYELNISSIEVKSITGGEDEIEIIVPTNFDPDELDPDELDPDLIDIDFEIEELEDTENNIVESKVIKPKTSNTSQKKKSKTSSSSSSSSTFEKDFNEAYNKHQKIKCLLDLADLIEKNGVSEFRRAIKKFYYGKKVDALFTNFFKNYKV